MKMSKGLFIGLAAVLLLFAASAFAQPSPGCNDCVTYCSYTQGGWGAPCNGGNAGCLRDMCFGDVYPNGVTIGRDFPNGCCWIHFTSAHAIEDFLPQGQTPAALTQNYTDPGVGNITGFAGQVLALQLNVDLGAYGCGDMVAIGDMVIAVGPFAGWTISAFLAAANDVLGGGTPPNGFTLTDFNGAANALNNNFDNCTDNDHYVEIPPAGQTVVIREHEQGFPASVCVDFTAQCPEACIVWWCNFCGPNDFGIFSAAPGCNGENCSSDDCTPNTGELEWGDQVILEPDPNGGCWWYVPVHATAPGCFCITLDFQLPVDLMSFTRTEGNGEVSLAWATASETNSDYFQVQRSTAGSSWTNLGRVNAHGTVQTTTNYSYVDNTVTNGTTYNYRLLVADLDGSVEQAGPVVTGTPSANAGVPEKFALYQNYPNPFNPSTSIAYDLAETGLVKITVFNMIGQQVATLVNGTQVAGHHVVSFDASGLPSALYIYKMETASFTTQMKMLLLK